MSGGNRSEQKALVRSWHTKRSIPIPTSTPSQSETLITDFDQHNHSLFELKPNESYETKGCDHHQGMTYPSTVGQIKHIYRTRTRQLESAVLVARVQREHSKSMSAAKKKIGSVTHNLVPRPLIPQIATPENQPAEPQEHQNTLYLRNLDTTTVLTNITYRDELLRTIRHKLSAGHNVVLCSTVPSQNELSDIKLMMQQLCTQSLLFCIREQEIIPTLDTNEVSLTLVARH